MMLMAITLSAMLFGLCGALHFVVLSKLQQHLQLGTYRHGVTMWLGLFGAGVAHVMEATLYAAGFALGAAAGLGGFTGIDLPVSFMDTFYFSLVNYTSLGLGDIYPTGHLRFMAGLESLNGFLLISCSAAFLYSLMSDGDTRPA